MSWPPEGSGPIPGGRPPARRLFFALWPDEEQRQALARAIARSARASGGRPVPLQSLHATLAFFGSVPEERMPELRALARRVAAGSGSQGAGLALSLVSLAHWPRSQVLVVLADDAAPGLAAVRSLAHALASEGSAAGFSPDLKPFRAHVTVARKVTRIPAMQPKRAVHWRFAEFALIESRTEPRGALYSVVESYPLVASEKVST